MILKTAPTLTRLVTVKSCLQTRSTSDQCPVFSRSQTKLKTESAAKKAEAGLNLPLTNLWSSENHEVPCFGTKTKHPFTFYQIVSQGPNYPASQTSFQHKNHLKPI